MTSEERNRIVSEDYADLLLEFLGDETILQSFPNATVNPINFLLSVVHVPVEYITNQTILEFGYSAMPSCLGLVSHESLEASGIQRLRNTCYHANTMEWGGVRGNQTDLDTIAISNYLIRGTKRNPNLTYPNRDWGYGILDIYNVFNVLRSDYDER